MAKGQKQEDAEITFHSDGFSGEGHAAINIKRYEWPDDLGDDLDELDQQRIFEAVQEEWHEEAAAITHSHGYSDCFTEGRTGGWLLPFRQVDSTGQVQFYSASYPRWPGQGGDKGFPAYPDVMEGNERKTFVAFRTEIETLLEQVPEMARTIATQYRINKDEAEAEKDERESAISEADVRQAQRQQVFDAFTNVTYFMNADRFEQLAQETRPDWHEPDEQGIGAIVFGRKLDNAFANHIDPIETEHSCEIVVVLTKDGKPYCSLNLATLLAEAAAYRRAVKFNGLHPSDVRGPIL